MQEHETKPLDLFVIGGGVNGTGIARDAAGRGLSVALAEQSDLGAATSSASTKLFHGGLRYLEYFEFRLVREALREREVLLRAMPHISRPMRFVLPYRRDMRFDSTTPVSKLVGVFMPWLKGRRPAWQIRLGLFLYDQMGGGKILPGTKRVDLTRDQAGGPLQPGYQQAFEYSDCWVDDARLVVLNARDAHDRGATIHVRTRVTRAERHDGLWRITLEDLRTGTETQHHARCLVNATGPWVSQLLHGVIDTGTRDKIRLVRGSHIVTRRLFDHDRSYFFQGKDGRIVFAIPYEDNFTLIGTTDCEHSDPDETPFCTEPEREYLCEFVSEYFEHPVTKEDIVWSYSGVRPLIDDGQSSASAASREYLLKLETDGGAPLLCVFGGKITTYRKLAEAALAKLAPFFPELAGPWTAGATLPGGESLLETLETLRKTLREQFPFLDEDWARRLLRCYGRDAWNILGNARSREDLGRDFGATLSEAELRWLVSREFAQTAEDVVWRRTKLGLLMSEEEIAALEEWMRLAQKTDDQFMPFAKKT